jgi:hypothetical protein
VKLLGRNTNDDGAADADDEGAPEVQPQAGTTAPKGRPTPKRSESTKRRGPVAPAPMTMGEARKRRKEMRRSMTKEERRAAKAKSRAAMAQRRERMMAGEEAYLLPRDRGPVRRYVRDVVDARRNVLGLFMPAALFLFFVMLGVPQLFASPAMPLLMVLMVVDGVVLGRKVNRAVDAKFPGNTESGWRLGLYAAGRASQIRRMRAPRPQVERGAKIA